jgi:hypothetical protein
MWIAYAIAALPLIIGLLIWIHDKDILWFEWLGSFVIALAIAAIFNAVIVSGMVNDIETWSGQITKAVYTPEWVEEYEQEHTIKDSDGNVTMRWYTTEHRTHWPTWSAYASFGKKNNSYVIDETSYKWIVQVFGQETKEKGWRCGYDRSRSKPGSEYDYIAVNKTGFVIPVSMTVDFENRVKAAPSVFSFVKVPKDTKGLFEWPRTTNSFASNRLLGLAKKDIDLFAFDQMSSRLGPTKKVNTIIIGWDSTKYDSSIAQYQEAKWIGGKKNDLVLCYGKRPDGTTEWAYVFGWTEKADVKINLQTILMDNKVATDLIPKIEQEIAANYELKDWDKFNYLTVEPPQKSYIWLFVIMILVQIPYWFIMKTNYATKENGGGFY